MSTRTSRGAEDLRRYFHSGWAFLIPYLAAYLLYWWLKWPVNPPSADHPFPASGLQPPCLLHVYWALHAINVVLAAVAIVSWWQCLRAEGQRAGSSEADEDTGLGSAASAGPTGGGPKTRREMA